MPDASPRFLLLLHEPPGRVQAPSPESGRALVEEYKAWAAEGARSGFLLGGEKLKDGGNLVAESGASPGSTAIALDPGRPFIGGYFLIRASGYDEAVELARTCPHLRHGGIIEVRQIDPV